MWIERKSKKHSFKHIVTTTSSQVVVVRGARQVGKTSFILNALQELKDYRQIFLNLAYHSKTEVNGQEFYGRDFFGATENASQLIKNIELITGSDNKDKKPIIVFIDEADRHPVSLESIQHLAGMTGRFKTIFTGSNLENVITKNAATGRKLFFDLYPITFVQFLEASNKQKELQYILQLTENLNRAEQTEFFHKSLSELFDTYTRLGGMPRVLSAFLDNELQSIPQIISDLVVTIEDNIKLVLGGNSKLYEYEDALRKLALASMETLKFSRLQVQHAGRSEAKKLVNKTVGARVAHKIRLFDDQQDLSKYLIFDTGVLNYLLNGSDLLAQSLTDLHRGIMNETVIGQELIAQMNTRDDLFYWKSERGAQVDFLLRSPKFAALDVKSTSGNPRSLNSCSLIEKKVDCLILIQDRPLHVNKGFVAKLPTESQTRKLPLISLPHYLVGQCLRILSAL